MLSAQKIAPISTKKPFSESQTYILGVLLVTQSNAKIFNIKNVIPKNKKNFKKTS